MITKEEAVKDLVRAIVVTAMRNNGLTEMEIADVLAGK